MKLIADILGFQCWAACLLKGAANRSPLDNANSFFASAVVMGVVQTGGFTGVKIPLSTNPSIVYDLSKKLVIPKLPE